MLSVNASMDDIHNYSFPQRSSQINPNSSSANIHQLNHPKASRSTLFSLSIPITPPASNSPTPVAEKNSNFYISRDNSQVDLVHTGDTRSDSRWIPQIHFETIALCGLWYLFSIVSANSTKAILSRFMYPVTLTQFQFVMNAILCVLLFIILNCFPKTASNFPHGSVPQFDTPELGVKKFLTPTKFIVSTTLPMGAFQFIGHITSHKATSVMPVSLVHTIKALSPISTVSIYRLFYKVKYPWATYVTLTPLVLGIMLTCYKPKKSKANSEHYISGLFYAFVSMLIFVTQNIFAKKRLTYTSEEPKETLPSYKDKSEQKLDKLTILLFCSIIGFILTIPVYAVLEFQNETFSLFQMSWFLAFLVFINGLSHFLQSLLAFLLLGTISPINYSIANIMKRIVVILFAFVWESSFSFSGTQGYGVGLTIIGLYCYDKWGGMSKKK